jgi:gamma-tubulin complex component 2
VPPPLERWKLKILLAGKYLNVIRECGIAITPGPDGNGGGDGAGDDEDELSLDDDR